MPRNANWANRMFGKVLEVAGMAMGGKNGERVGPNPCCLRHTFVHRAYKQHAKASGHSFDDIIPFVSVCVGHEDMDGTDHCLRYQSDLFEEDNDIMDMIVDGVMPS
jgi:integrase